MMKNLTLSKDLVVVSYYTDTRYEAFAHRMIASAISFGLSHDVRAVEDRGSFRLNEKGIPSFILDRLEEYHDRTVVWIDADALIKADPVKLRGGDWDLAVYTGNRGEPWPGTLAVRATEASRAALRFWAEQCRVYESHRYSGGFLRPALSDPKLRWRRLPAGYCWVAAQMRSLLPREPVVIEHFRASLNKRTFHDSRRAHCTP